MAAVENSLKSNTRMVWVESPSNPTLEVLDLVKISTIINKHNKENQMQAPDKESSGKTPILEKESGKKVLLVVDNTFLTPYFQRPLELGGDIVIHSCTKYLNGASDVIMGAACVNDQLIRDKLVFIQSSAGAIPSPFDCYLLQRSIR